MKPVVRSLSNARVFGLFGEYDHQISFNEGSEFVIIHGPNGVGKTKFFEIIHSLSRLSVNQLSSLPFERAELVYSDGSILSARRPSAVQPELESGILIPEVTISLDEGGNDPGKIEWVFRNEADEALSRLTPYERIDDQIWFDPSDGERIRREDLVRRYRHYIEEVELNIQTPPPTLTQFVESVPSFLIETQRLLVDEQVSEQRHLSKGRLRPRWTKIEEQASNLKKLLSQSQTEHSRITQRLDRTFPSRVLALATQSEVIDFSEVQRRHAEQNILRSRLGQIGSIALADELPLPEQGVDRWTLSVLNLYLQDGEEKLQPFVELVEKVDLLENIINRRLLKKALAVKDENGLLITNVDSESVIPLKALSSGEQHEIILMIALLFQVPKGAIVLIDEPEISLHVAWQVAFIPDVKQIAELVGFRFIVATHSPQIINDQWSQTIDLNAGSGS